MAINPQDFDVKPIGDAGLTERTVLDGSERILVQGGPDEDVDITPMEFVKYSTIQAMIDILKGLGWAGQTVKGNADDILLRENLSNKKSTLVENSETYYPNQKAVNDGLDTKTSKSQIAYDNDTTSFIANTLASGAIIERGSNANGEYVKFADGTMVCRLSNFAIAYNNANTLASNWTYPSPFINPYTALTCLPYSSDVEGITGGWENFGAVGYSNRTSYGFRLTVYMNGTSFGSTDSCAVSVIAIGRWK